MRMYFTTVIKLSNRMWRGVFIISLFITGTLPPGVSCAEDGVKPESIGIEEKAGKGIPLGAIFFDESGRTVSLRELLDKPALISFAYYRCTNLCNDISGNISGIIKGIGSEPVRDFSLITISFDENDTPREAAAKKRAALKAIGSPFPEGGWRFLTGDAENIKKVTASAGFGFKRQGEGFIHPAALVAVSPEGRIIRYMYGDRYLPAEIDMAIAEASAGRPVPAIPKALLFCYRYNPQSGAYVFSVLRLFAALTLLSAFGFCVYLFGSSRRHEGQ